MDGLQIVAEPRRRGILRLIWDRELAAGEIAKHFEVSFAAISQHLAVLREAGFVSLRRDGRQRFYRADHAGLGELTALLEGMWAHDLDRLAAAAEAAEREEAAR